MFEHNFCRYLKISLGWRYKKTTKQYNCFVTRGLITWSGLYHVNNFYVSSVYFLDVLNLQRPSFVCICSVVGYALDWREEGLWLAAHMFFLLRKNFCVFQKWTKCDWSESLKLTCFEISLLFHFYSVMLRFETQNQNHINVLWFAFLM